MRERDVEARLVRAVAQAGGRAYKWASPGRRSVPDRLCLFPGARVVFVECKRPGGRSTRAQAHEQSKLAALGFQVVEVDWLVSVEEVREWLR